VRKLNILFFGCGFIASHLIPFLTPFMNKAVLVDRERLESVNYDNGIYPKGYVGRRKVSALMALLNVLSDLTVVPIHRDISRADELLEIIKSNSVDLMVVSVDNLEARHIALKATADAGIDAVFIGVTEDFGYIDWGDRVYLPSLEEKEDIEEILKGVRDVCTRIEFRPLGALSASLAFTAIFNYILHRSRTAYIFWHSSGRINVVSLKR